MKVVLIGATGFVGSKIVKELLQRGHKVKAIARNTTFIEADNNLEKISTDIHDTAKMIKECTDADAVISAFNAGWTNPNLYNDFVIGSKAIQKAAEEANVNRYIVVGGAGSLINEKGIQFVDDPTFPERIKTGALAARDYYDFLKTNTLLNWTYFSPAIEMHPGTSGIRKGVYRTGTDYPVYDDKGKSILSVEDVAVAIVDELEHSKFLKKRFTAAY